MKSEFEKWLGDVWLSDAEWDESKNTYSDSRIHCMWSAWQHQQSKVDELQKRVDKAIRLLVEAELYQSEPNIDLAVQALKGDQ